MPQAFEVITVPIEETEAREKVWDLVEDWQMDGNSLSELEMAFKDVFNAIAKATGPTHH